MSDDQSKYVIDQPSAQELYDAINSLPNRIYSALEVDYDAIDGLSITFADLGSSLPSDMPHIEYVVVSVNVERVEQTHLIATVRPYGKLLASGNNTPMKLLLATAAEGVWGGTVTVAADMLNKRLADSILTYDNQQMLED